MTYSNVKTVKQLKAECKQLGIKGYSKLNKKELIEKLNGYTPNQAKDLGNYTVQELKAMAKEKGLKKYSRLNKTNLIALLEKNGTREQENKMSTNTPSIETTATGLTKLLKTLVGLAKENPIKSNAVRVRPAKHGIIFSAHNGQVEGEVFVPNGVFEGYSENNYHVDITILLKVLKSLKSTSIEIICNCHKNTLSIQSYGKTVRTIAFDKLTVYYPSFNPGEYTLQELSPIETANLIQASYLASSFLSPHGNNTLTDYMTIYANNSSISTDGFLSAKTNTKHGIKSDIRLNKKTLSLLAAIAPINLAYGINSTQKLIVFKAGQITLITQIDKAFDENQKLLDLWNNLDQETTVDSVIKTETLYNTLAMARKWVNKDYLAETSVKWGNLGIELVLKESDLVSVDINGTTTISRKDYVLPKIDINLLYRIIKDIRKYGNEYCTISLTFNNDFPLIKISDPNFSTEYLLAASI